MAAVRKLDVAADARGQAAGDAYLGIAQSAKGYRWLERLRPEDVNTATAISQQHNLPELLGRVLAARGVGLEDVATVLDPTIKELMPDPSSLRDMDKAAARLADAIEARTNIAIFGDYDVDGGSSSALMQRFLNAHGLSGRIYIPDRLFEGYGPNSAAIESLIKQGAGLIVTVDCGTTSFEPLGLAGKLGVDVIVVDHHQADEHLPDVHSVINPNRQDDLSGLGQLCAAGVVFMLLVATSRELRRRGAYDDKRSAPDLLNLLDLVGLATVCDVVPLQGLNRAFVVKGLQVMKGRRNVGLRALFDVAGLSSAPAPYHLGFVIGPRINAGGRIGDSALGAKLLSTNDETEAARIAALLDRLNKERKAIESKMLEAAMAEAEVMVEQEPDLAMLIVGSKDWHKGVVGLVARRLTERFHRPSCVIAWQAQEAQREGASAANSEGTGSLRSVAGVDVGAAVRLATSQGLLVKGGGHAMAAGLTVKADRFDELKAFMNDQLLDMASTARARASLEMDGALTPRGVNNDLMDLIERAGPYGQGNPQPRFAFPAHHVKFAKVVGENHVRCTLQAGDGARIDGIAFRAAGQPLGDLLLGSGGRPLHIAGSLKRDSWGGRQKIDLFIEDAADPRR